MQPNNSQQGVKPSSQTFGDLLSHATRSLAHLLQKSQTELLKEISAEIGVSPTTIEYWKQGHVPKKHDILLALTKSIFLRGHGRYEPELKKFDRDWLWNFLFHGNHPHPEEICEQWFSNGADVQEESSPTISLPTAQTVISPNGKTKSATVLLPQPTAVPSTARDHLLQVIKKIPRWTIFVVLTGLIFAALYPSARNYIVTRHWAFRNGRSDDINLVLVNGHIVAYRDNRNTNEPEWVPIPVTSATSPTEVVFINLNGPVSAVRNFDLQYGGKLVQSFQEGMADEVTAPYSMTYIRKVRLYPNGEWESFEQASPPIYDKREDQWVVYFDARQLGLILVNGEVVAGTYLRSQGGFPLSFDLSPYIIPRQENQLTIMVWNHDREPYWKIEIQKNGEVIGEPILEMRPKSKTGEVFYQEWQIDEHGNLSTK